MKEKVRKIVEELGKRLTDKGRDILIQQEKNVEHALGQLQQPTQGYESPTHHTPTSEPERQRKLSFDELYKNPTPPPQPHQEQPRPQEWPSHPKRPPPLRRHREHRHLAGERVRHHPQGHRTQAHHTPTAEYRRKAEYGRMYEESPTKKDQEPEHHSPTLGRGIGRKPDYRKLYEEPTDESDEQREPEREKDGPEQKI